MSSSSSGRGGARTVAGYVLTEKLGSGSLRLCTRREGTPTQATLIAGGSTDLRLSLLSDIEIAPARRQTCQFGERDIHIEKLHHPNIVRLYGIHKSERHIYLFLEYCDMGDLRLHPQPASKAARGKRRARLRAACRELGFCGLKISFIEISSLKFCCCPRGWDARFRRSRSPTLALHAT